MYDNGFKAVVFELDNVLYPERQYVISGCKAVSKYLERLYGIDFFQDLVDQYEKGEQDFIVAALKNRFKAVEALLAQKAHEIFRCHFPRLDLYSDARVALALLARAGLKKALVTDGYGYVQRCKVDSLGLRPLIDSCVFSDDLGGEEYWKPSPDPFFIMSLQLDVDVSQTIFVGADPEKDFTAPLSLGMSAIRVVRDGTFNSPQHASVINISSLDYILQAIEKLPSHEKSACKNG